MTFKLAIDLAVLLCFVVYLVLSGINWWLDKKRRALLRRKHQRDREELQQLIDDALANPGSREKQMLVSMRFVEIMTQKSTEE